MRLLAVIVSLSLCLPLAAIAQGAKDFAPASENALDLKPGQFIWEPNATPAGPVVTLVSLAEQLAVVYRNGVRVGASNVSTGRPGFTTPTGVFTILQKDASHHSSIYNNALMPYTERLTWSGVALHAGGLPGYPSSHGCIHLPAAFAKALFGMTTAGMAVIISDKPVQAATMQGATFLVAHDAAGKGDQAPADEDAFAWQPRLAPAGPLSIVVSTADRRLVAIRNGVEIGSARVRISGEGALGTHALMLMQSEGAETDRSAFEKAGYSWHQVALPSASAETASGCSADSARRPCFPA